MRKIEKRSNKLLWASLLLFGLEYLAIIGYYWLFGGHLGNSRFTISIFVGLQWWSIILFCAINTIIAILLLTYVITQSKINCFLWRVLMFAFLIAYIGLSIAAKTSFSVTSTEIHQFFSNSLFIIITFISLLMIFIARDMQTRILAILIALYGIFFVSCYVLKETFFMDNILWHESAYIFAFFTLTITANRSRASIDI